MDFYKTCKHGTLQTHRHLTICCRIVQIKGKLRKQRCDLLSVDFFKPIAVTSTVILGQLTKWYGKLQLQLLKKYFFFGCRGTELEVIV